MGQKLGPFIITKLNTYLAQEVGELKEDQGKMKQLQAQPPPHFKVTQQSQMYELQMAAASLPPSKSPTQISNGQL